MPPNPFSGLTIVVVEDHDDSRRYLGFFLRRLGANVVVARDAVEGLEAIRNNHPNLVLSDIALPGVDGFALLREIRALGPDAGGNVPVIAVTALFAQASRDDSDCAQRLNGRFERYDLFRASVWCSEHIRYFFSGLSENVRCL
jgi:CheY-like chemotaxis protein